MNCLPLPIPTQTASQRRVVAIDSKTTARPSLNLSEGQEPQGASAIPGLFLVPTDCRQPAGTEPPPVRSREQQRQRSMNSIGWLSTSIIHDLRNPLTTVFASAEMLLELDPASPQAKRLIGNIYKAASSMRDLLSNLADTSIELKSAIEICSVHDVVLAASRAALLRGGVQTVELLLAIPPEFEISVERARVEKVFFNLVTNALEAMPHGGVICIRARNVNDCVLIDVEDSGPGIPRAILDRLFEPFATAGKAHGLGLGLALSRQVVLDQGGDMWTEPASGARFVISLPLHSREIN